MGGCGTKGDPDAERDAMWKKVEAETKSKLARQRASQDAGEGGGSSSSSSAAAVNGVASVAHPPSAAAPTADAWAAHYD